MSSHWHWCRALIVRRHQNGEHRLVFHPARGLGLASHSRNHLETKCREARADNAEHQQKEMNASMRLLAPLCFTRAEFPYGLNNTQLETINIWRTVAGCDQIQNSLRKSYIRYGSHNHRGREASHLQLRPIYSMPFLSNSVYLNV
jgi:hypothetical protein